MTKLPDALALAWGTLTAIPGRPPRTVDRAVAGWAMALGWLVVLPVMLAASAAGWGLTTAGVPATASGVVVVGLVQLATRAIHADGLADTVDGLGSGRPREQALEIMRRGDVGPMGVVALVVVLGLQAVLLGDLLGRPGGWLLAGAALAVGRLALVHGCARWVPAARADGLGASVIGSVPTWLATALTLALFVAGMQLTAGLVGWFGPGLAPTGWAWGMVAGLGLTLATVAAAVRRLGGVTGDVLGALVELMTVGLLLGLAIR